MATDYYYPIYQPGDSENVAATFSTGEPIAHIQVGHWLTLSTRDFPMQTDHRLRIEGVECHLSENQYGQFVSPIRVEVYVSEEVRTPQQ